MDLIKHIEDSFHWGELEVSKLTQEIINIHGITSNKVKCFLNNLCNIDGATYLEIGVFRGSTFCSAIYGNDITAIGIDNWSSPYLMPSGVSQKLNFYMKDSDSDPKEEFIYNVKKFGTEGKVSVYRGNYLDFDYNILPKIDIVFYDGETKYYDQYTTIKKILPIMRDNSIIVMDDWNWSNESVVKAIEDSGFYIQHHKSVFTNGEDMKDFWNGIGVFLISRS